MAYMTLKCWEVQMSANLVFDNGRSGLVTYFFIFLFASLNVVQISQLHNNQ